MSYNIDSVFGIGMMDGALTVFTSSKRGWDEDQCQDDHYEDDTPEVMRDNFFGEDMDCTFSEMMGYWDAEQRKMIERTTPAKTREGIMKMMVDAGFVYNEEFEKFVMEE